MKDKDLSQPQSEKSFRVLVIIGVVYIVESSDV